MGLYKEVTDERIEASLMRFKEGGERELLSRYRKKIQYEESLTRIRTVRSLEQLALWKEFCGKELDKLTREDVQKGLANLEYANRKKRRIKGQNGKVYSEGETGKYSEWSKVTYKLTFKKFLRWAGMEVSWFKIKRRVDVSRGEPLNEDDIKKMMEASVSIRDLALLSVMWESGARIGEISNLRICDVTFEDFGTRLRLDGKTGVRFIMTVTCTPYLITWLREHPNKEDKNSPLFVNYIRRGKGKPLSYQYIRKLLFYLAAKAKINKQVNPHWFRHSRITFCAKRWSESILKKYFGWTDRSTQATTYTHLACKDTDEAVAELYGMQLQKNASNHKPIRCSRCEFSNGFSEKICSRCGYPLSAEFIDEAKNRKKTEIIDAFKQLVIDDPSFLYALKAAAEKMDDSRNQS